jgi:diguanylate cyclase (GGDEF)-like protein/PAS domain S-box-containing protein
MAPARDSTEEGPAEERYRELAEQLPVGLLCCRDGRITYINPAGREMLGVTSLDEVASRPFLDFIHPDSRSLAETRGRVLQSGSSLPGTVRQRLLRADGTTVDIEVMTVGFEDCAGRGIYSLAVDITDRLRAEEALQKSEARWRSLVHNASDIVALLNPDGTLEYATPAAERLLGYAADSNEGHNLAEFIHPDDLTEVATVFAQLVETPGGQTRTEFRVARRDGSWCWVESLATNRLADPLVNGIVCNVRDVSDRKAGEEALRRQATHDALTGLPNRVALTTALDAASKQRGSPGALLLVDLDGFKDINDGLGHDVGDRVLQEMARRLRARTRSSDVVARLGGDEFALWLTGIERREQATAVAESILGGLREPVDIDGTLLYLAASIGVAHRPEHGEDGTALLQAADVAMYRAKEQGMAWAVYTTGDQEQHRHRLTLLSELRQALDRGEVDVHFQPKLELATGTVLGVEALVRCTLPTLGSVEPEEFIPLVERTGLIRPLTAHILRLALRQCARWRAEGMPLSIAVNLSASSLRDPGLVTTVRTALAESGVPAACLTLEITETALAEGTAMAMRAMSDLRRQGIRLAIDDLGIGYSSMAYLKRLPINEVKIDKSLIIDLNTDRDRAIVKSLVDLGHSLGLTVVAEGVETAAAADTLTTLGCDLAQGYFYCPPQPGSVLTGWLLDRLVKEGRTFTA